MARIKEFLYIKKINIQAVFNVLLDLYPQFLRCGIINIYKLYKLKKEKKKLKNYLFIQIISV